MFHRRLEPVRAHHVSILQTLIFLAYLRTPIPLKLGPIIIFRSTIFNYFYLGDISHGKA